MKMKIKWHEECLKNRKCSLEYKLEELHRLNKEIEGSSWAVQVYENQIKEAIQQGKDGFDSERFLIPRKKKTTIECEFNG